MLRGNSKMAKVEKLLQEVALGNPSVFDELKKHLAKARNIHKSWTHFCALHRASYEGWDDIVELLLKSGVNPDVGAERNQPSAHNNYFWGWSQTFECFSPLFLAARRGHLETVKLLLKAGAKVELWDSKGFSGPLGPLEAAAEGGHTKIVEALLVHGEDQNKSQVNAALRAASKPDTVHVLLQAGADPFDLDELGVGAIHEYAYNGLPECLGVLLRSRAPEHLVFKTRAGFTALHAAAVSGNRRCAAILIEAGAKVEAKDNLEATPLHYASAKSCGCNIITMLVNGGCCVNAKDKFGKTALHWAVSANCVETVKTLIDCGADVEATDARGRKPVDILPLDRTEVKEGFVDAVMPILQPNCPSSDADAKVIPEEGVGVTELSESSERKTTSPVELRKIAIWEMRKLLCKSYKHRKSERKYVECNKSLLKDLLRKVPEVVHTYSGLRALFQVAHSKDPELMKMFLVAGANPNSRDTDICVDDDCPMLCDCVGRGFCDGSSLLHAAAEQNNAEVVKLLLKYGASWDRIRTNSYVHLWGPLEAAGVYARINSLKPLLEVGAGTDIMQLNSALWYVCNPEITKDYYDHEFAGAIRLLLNAGADPNFMSLKTEFRGTSLHGATAGNWPESITLLLRRGADISVKASNGWTPIVMSLHRWESFPVVKMLLDRGADISFVDDKGKTVLHFAAGRYRNWECIKFLIAAGAKVDVKDKSGATPLIEAAKYSSTRTNIFSALLEAGANINARDKQRRSVLHWATKHNNYENVEYLVKAGANLNVVDNKGRTPFDNMIFSSDHTDEFRWKVLHLLRLKGYSPTLMKK